MKLLFVCQYYYPEPARLPDICKSLIERGHQITVLTGLANYPEGTVLPEYRRGKNRVETIDGVRVIRSFLIGRGKSKPRLFLNYMSFALFSTLKASTLEADYDVVFVNQLSPVMMAYPAIRYKKKHKKKLLFYSLDLWPASLSAGGIQSHSLAYKIFWKLSRAIYAQADKLLVSSKMFIDYFRDELLLNDLPIEHLPQYAEELFNGVTHKDGGEADLFNFVFAGNIGHMQSVDTVIRAAHALRDHTNIVFHIVGDGSALQSCKNLCDQLSLDNRVIFYGRKPVDDMPRFYSMADAMLITLKADQIISYTLPGKLQSYMAAGKPVIGAIDGEAQQVIREANCGLCCNAEDHEALARIILEFIAAADRAQMRVNAKNYYEAHYLKNTFIDKLESELEALAAH